MAEMAWIAIALFIGGLVKGVTGFGLPMISVPLLALTLTVEYSVGLISLPILFANLIQVRGLSAGLWRQRWLQLLVISLLVGLGISGVLVSGNPRWLALLTGGSITLFALISLAGVRLSIRPALRSSVALVTGGFAGLIGGSTAMYGWPLVMYLSSLALSPSQFIGAISLLYLLAHSGFLLTLLYGDMLSLSLLLQSAFACIPVFGGLFFGRWFSKRFATGRRFYTLVCLLMLGGGVSLLGIV